MSKLDDLMNKQKFFRRLILVWVLVVTTDFYLFIKDYELLKEIGPSGTSVVLGVFGLLATIIGFYQWHRKSDDEMYERMKREKDV